MKKDVPFLGLLALVVLVGCSRGREMPPAEASKMPASTSSGPKRIKLPENSPKLQRIRVEPLQYAEVARDEVDAPGRIEANPNRVSRVMMPVAGRVKEVIVKIGDSVSQGQPLLTLESPEVGAALSAYRQAQAALSQAKAAQFKAETDLERLRDLLEHRAAAKKDVLVAENALAQANASVEQAQSAGEEARRRLEILGLKPGDFAQRITVRAPMRGKILEMNVAPGEYRTDTNAPLLTIADLSSVWVTADVPESSIRLIKIGQSLEIELDAYPGERFSAKVTRIADTVDPQTRTIRVRAEMNNRKGQFRPEMFCRVRRREAVERQPVVPVGAVIADEGRTIVFVEVAKGEFQEVEVAVGRKEGQRVPVLRGLNDGDRVVIDGAMLLRGY